MKAKNIFTLINFVGRLLVISGFLSSYWFMLEFKITQNTLPIFTSTLIIVFGVFGMIVGDMNKNDALSKEVAPK